MHPCERVGLDFTETAPFVFRDNVDLAITPEQLFEVLADADSWPRWAPVITNITWASPEPRGVGTTRIVEMRGGLKPLVGDEEYLAWVAPLLNVALRRFLRNLRRYNDARYSTSPQH
ncbi:SRPBCC family protein [Mycobacterium tilburgii]|uniref:SRPBCC family protein n=1 Tax=Mycobacterium tilburgii TaxID=44467 RepID=UPI001182F7D2|nr:SRPBCC family protein [Mycobacterium tilburgii]